MSQKQTAQEKNAAILVIGNEILSGRTRDSNIHTIAGMLDQIGITLAEARIVPDVQAVIVATLNELRARHDYVFTTGGIGPTHDDITAEAISVAFGVALPEHPEALARLEHHYGAAEFTPARRRMARIPEGGTLIDNPVSVAPGFRIGNVFVLPGVPKIMQPMMAGILPALEGGPRKYSVTVSTLLPESVLADGMAAIQAAYPSIQIGSYPYMKPGQTGVSVVLRATDQAVLAAAEQAIRDLIAAQGGMVLLVPLST